MGNLYSIGHSKHDLSVFLELLKKYHINYILDVRSVPYSRFSPDYNRESIQKTLEQNEIRYCYMGKYFGARQEDRSLYTGEILDFEKMIRQQFFAKGKESVEKGLQLGNTIAFMCTEKDPLDCHRAIMVARAFLEDGIITEHIMPDGTLQSQKDIEQRLLDKYYPDRDQLSFLIPERPEEELILDCYRKRNNEIGFHYEEESV